MRNDTYNNQFETVSILGQGSFGKVTHSVRKKDGKSFAVKEIKFNKSGFDKQQILEMTQEEVNNLIKLSYEPCNPNDVYYNLKYCFGIDIKIDRISKILS